MPDSLKIAGVVILYHPSEDVVSNIKTYYDWLDKIYVFDNTKGDSYVKGTLEGLSKIEFFQNGDNYGIAKNLNRAVRFAIKENFDWMLTMDQDTSFPEDAIQNYIRCFHDYANKEMVALFGTSYAHTKKNVIKECTGLEVNNLITSGALLNLSLFEKIGEFDEQLFIDSVDHDYCIRAKLGGYFIIKFSAIFVEHTLGRIVYRASIKTFFFIKKKKNIHSPLRCYYMYRNMLYLEAKYKHTDIYLAKELRKIVTGNLKNSFFYSRQPWKISYYLALAYQDFKKGKMGKKSNNH